MYVDLSVDDCLNITLFNNIGESMRWLSLIKFKDCCGDEYIENEAGDVQIHSCGCCILFA
ncbi:hypothetical protein CTM87_01280 [Photobacterium phosphoreum]|nr:hypothetical protein AYY24_01255 [Photobacterium phosphoreum]PSW38952.1 hypothetical protein CTM87_01280 [Photobacterium phosphoreum]